MADTWFRVYNSVRHNRKISRLSDAHFRSWIMLLSVASEEGGRIPGDIADISHELRVSQGKARDVLQVLISAGLIERDGDGYLPHNWNDKQFKSDASRDRQQRYRDRHKKRNGDGESDVTVTVQEAEAETETYTETEKIPSLRSGSERAPEPVIASQAEEPVIPAFLKREKPKKHRLPDDFEPKRNLATTYWLKKARPDLARDVEDQVTQFKAHHRKLGSQMEDWDSAWVTWYSKAPEMTRPQTVEYTNGSLSLAELIATKERAEKQGIRTDKLDKAIAELTEKRAAA